MKTPRLGRRVMRAIGRQLRELYADIIADGVPERFSAILRRLDDPNTQDEPPAAPSSADGLQAAMTYRPMAARLTNAES